MVSNKTYEIAGRIFEDDLAKAVKQSLAQKSYSKKYQLKPHKLNYIYLNIEI